MGADGHSADENSPATSSDEEAFCPLMAQVCLLVVAGSFLLCMCLRGKDDRKIKTQHFRSGGKSRVRSMKSSESEKSSLSRGAANKGR